VDTSFTTTDLEICKVFGEGRSFRGDVGKFALEKTPYGLNPELAAPDPHVDPTANRQGQREHAVMQVAGATNLLTGANNLEGAITAGMSSLIAAMHVQRPRRELPR